MAKANKKSLNAKVYINDKVNEMRESFHKASDEKTREQLIETFKKTTSSDEYKDNLNVVHEDTKAIRKDAKETWWERLTSEEFESTKTEFYGKDMSLEFWEDFEKLDLWKKLDFIFEKFWDTDYAADLVIKLLKSLIPEHDYKGGRYYLKNVIDELVGWTKDGIYYNKQIYDWLSEKFWNGIVTARIYFHLWDHVNWGWGYEDWLEKIPYRYENMTEKTLKKLLTTEEFKTYVLKFLLWNKGKIYVKNLVRWCRDWSISDLWLIDILKDIITIDDDVMNKLSLEWQKYIANYFEKK